MKVVELRTVIFVKSRWARSWNTFLVSYSILLVTWFVYLLPRNVKNGKNVIYGGPEFELFVEATTTKHYTDKDGAVVNKRLACNKFNLID